MSFPAPSQMQPTQPGQRPPSAPASAAALNRGSVGMAIGFAVTAAILFNPLFATSFWVLLGRCLFVAMVLLLAFVGAQRLPERWLPRWMPRWLAGVLAVALAAPLATVLIYGVAVGGRVDEFFSHGGRITGFFIFTSTALVLGLIIALTAQVRERETRAKAMALQFELERSRLEKQAVDARLALLQAQIEPHFLFNTLANVQALVESGSPRAAGVLQALIAYLRAAMPRLHEREPRLADELKLVQAYLALMQMRLPDRLAFHIELPAELHSLRFPAMALLTLVENAVRHGIDPSENGGTIHLGGQLEAGQARVWVQDSGPGIHETAGGGGTGLANLRARLAGFFGGGAELQLHEVLPHGLKAEIVWRP
jgi:signal transduction histidine kinase